MSQLFLPRIIRIYILSLASSGLFLTSCLHREETDQETYSTPYYLQYKDTWIGILPKVGGTVVYLSDGSRVNVLSSDSSLWYQKKDALPPMGTRYNPRPYKGHTVWLGPQKEWWAQQNVDPSLTHSGAPWPPDPYLAFGQFTMLPGNDSSVRMISPISPISGVQLTKEMIITAPHCITFRATIHNMRKTSVSWDLWMNTRLDGYSHVYVPATGLRNILRMDLGQDKETQPVQYTIDKGYFTFYPNFPAASRTRRRAKAYLVPDVPIIAAFSNNYLFVKTFEAYPTSEIHPDQAPVELFNCISVNNEETVLELETHGKYTKLEPGDSLSHEEHWQLIHYPGTNLRDEEIRFLKSNL